MKDSLVEYAKLLQHPWRMLGFGYFQAWTYLTVLSPTLFSDGQVMEGASVHTSILMSGFLTASIICLLVLDAIKGIHEKPYLLLCSCFLGSLGTAFMGLATEMSSSLIPIGAMCSCIGTAFLIICWGRQWATMDTTRMTGHLTASAIFSCLCCFALSLLPASLLLLFNCLLPLASGLTLVSCKDEPRRPVLQREKAIFPPTWKLLTMIVTVAVSYSLIRSYFCGGSLSLFGAPYHMVMMSFAVFTVILVAAVVMRRNHNPICAVYRVAITIILLGFISLLAIPSGYRWVSLGAVMLGYSLFSELIWLMNPTLEVKVGDSSYSVFGWTRAILHLAAFFGVVFGTWLLSQHWISDYAAMLGCLLMSSLVVFLAVNVLTEHDFDSYLNPIRIDAPSLPTKKVTLDSILDEACTALTTRYHLTSRESDVLLLLAKGRSLPYIETQLFISNSTARTHTRNIYAKMDIHTRQALVSLVDDECLVIEGKH